ncbi:hypothetical protein NR798_37540 [Archangium gephyra]|uniref:hypothetical protein n=1 Tax=Archangium gephyra TaxID=48 RepID=UPI0035D3DC82
MKTVMSLAATAVLLLGAKAQAFGENLLSCQNGGFVLTRCTLQRVPLAAPVLEDGSTYETEYTVSYNFACTGHSVNVGVSTGAQYVPFVMGATNATLRIVGAAGAETYDPDPAATQRLSFKPGCSLTVSSAAVFPSNNTLILWTSQSQSQAKIINLSAERYLLAKDYQAISSWYESKLLLLKEKLDSLVVAFPTNIHYKVMRDTVNAALANAPAPYSEEVIGEAGEELIITLRAELDAEIVTGQKLVNRFTRWQLQAEQSLVDALANVPAP